MYHTFQATAASNGTPESRPDKARRQRAAVRNACNDCRRRKIRCDGGQPCNQCVWYKQIPLCAYTAPEQRRTSSKKSLREVQAQLRRHQTVLARLFPGRDVDQLLLLPRDDLLALTARPLAHGCSDEGPPSTGAALYLDQESTSDDESDDLKSLEQAPTHQIQPNESPHRSHAINLVSDDVNSLSLRVDKPSSYVGISSISTAFKVIFKIIPEVRAYILQSFADTAPPTRSNSPPPLLQRLSPYDLPTSDRAQKLVESYFNRVHLLMPMIDESLFWDIFHTGHRQDPSWLALLNMVFALGSLAGSSCDDEEHHIYFQRAKTHISLESFGSSSLFMLQALGLLSGYYMHWLNRPNEANCLLGATIRMATALGLHREYHNGASELIAGDPEPSADIRRRTWWSLFCLDVWASTSTGRPSLGRTGPGVTVNNPKVSYWMESTGEEESLKLLPLVHNIEFCKLATRILDTLASRLLPRLEEIFALDAQLVEWHNGLPSLLHIPASESDRGDVEGSHHVGKEHASAKFEPLITPRAIMLWRYQNLRMLMYRPFLLSAALQKTELSSMSKDERLATERCRSIAGETIACIDATCEHELIAGWNAVWMMYQAAMVPLLSLFSHASSAQKYNCNGSEASADIMKWRGQVETALVFFDKMRDSSAAAEKSKDVIERLFAASKHVQELRGLHHSSGDYSASSAQSARGGANYTQSSPSHVEANPTLDIDPIMSQGYPAEQLEPTDSNGMDMLWNDMLWDTWADPTDWTQGLEYLDWDPWTTSIQSYGNQVFR